MAMHDFYDAKTNIPQKRVLECQIEGTGAATPTKKYGPGVTVTRTSAGLYRFSFSYVPGRFLGCSYCFGAAAPSAVANHDAQHDDLVAASGSTEAYVEVLVEDGAAADDLEDEEYLKVDFHFSDSNLITLGNS